jgi:DNA-binding NarL/FixJ family response regulator
VVLDIRMPPTFTDEGARAAAAIKRAHPSVGVLVLSQHIETTHAVELVPLGGFGYLLKDRVLAVGEFLEAAERVARGGSALDPQVVGRLLGRDRTLSELSDREREVLALMAEGRQAAFPIRPNRRGARAPCAFQAQHPRARRRSPARARRTRASARKR